MSDLPLCQKPLLVLPFAPTEADLISLCALAKYYHLKNLPVTIFAPSSTTTTINKLVGSVNIVQELGPQKLHIKMERGTADIDSIQWQQTDTEVEVFINIANGQLATDKIKARMTGVECDLVILLNIADHTSIPGLDIEKLSGIPVVSICETELTESSYIHIFDQNLSTFTEQIIELVSLSELTQPASQLFLTGILSETDFLQQDLKHTATYETVKTLIDKGAMISEASRTLEDLK